MPAGDEGLLGRQGKASLRLNVLAGEVTPPIIQLEGGPRLSQKVILWGTGLRSLCWGKRVAGLGREMSRRGYVPSQLGPVWSEGAPLTLFGQARLPAKSPMRRNVRLGVRMRVCMQPLQRMPPSGMD